MPEWMVRAPDEPTSPSGPIASAARPEILVAADPYQRDFAELYRYADFDSLIELLGHAGSGIVMLLGNPGCGKTALLSGLHLLTSGHDPWPSFVLPHHVTIDHRDSSSDQCSSFSSWRGLGYPATTDHRDLSSLTSFAPRLTRLEERIRHDASLVGRDAPRSSTDEELQQNNRIAVRFLRFAARQLDVSRKRLTSRVTRAALKRSATVFDPERLTRALRKYARIVLRRILGIERHHFVELSDIMAWQHVVRQHAIRGPDLDRKTPRTIVFRELAAA